MAAKKAKPQKRTATNEALRIVEEIRVELGEASALVPLGGRRFLVADDEGGVHLVDAGKGKGTSTIIIAAGDDERVAGLEGMCTIAHDGKGEQRVLAVRESDGAMVSFALPTKGAVHGKSVTVHDAGVLQRPAGSPGKKNKGWEGIAFLHADAAFDKRGHLVAVHEGKPRAVGVFSFPGFKLERTLEIEGEIDALLPDLSDVAVHPKTGELWILSDEGERVVRAKLTPTALQLVGTHDVPVEDGEKPEGLAFDENGALWLVTDDSGRLLRLE